MTGDGAMTRRERGLFWGVLLAVVMLGLYALRDVLVPFVAGMAVAYLLDPVVDRLERLRIGRGLATFLVLFGFFAVALGLLLLLIPLLQSQVEKLAGALPGYVEMARERLGPLLSSLGEGIDPQLQTAVLILQAQAIARLQAGDEMRHAMREPAAAGR